MQNSVHGGVELDNKTERFQKNDKRVMPCGITLLLDPIWDDQKS